MLLLLYRQWSEEGSIVVKFLIGDKLFIFKYLFQLKWKLKAAEQHLPA